MAEKEYIEKSAIRQALYHEAFETDTEYQRWDSGCWIRYKLFENVVDALPTADVRPVIRGKWKKHYADHEAFGERPFCRYCSVCNAITVFPYNFCPNCGADMRQEEDNHG